MATGSGKYKSQGGLRGISPAKARRGNFDKDYEGTLPF